MESLELLWIAIAALATTYGPPPGPDGERVFHHSELIRLRTVTAFRSETVEPVRCVFSLRLDRNGVPRADGVEQQARNEETCEPAAADVAKAALMQWRFAPSWVGDSYVPARTLIAVKVSDRPTETWELPIEERVCPLD